MRGIEYTPEEIAEKKSFVINWLTESVRGTFTQAAHAAGMARGLLYQWRIDDEDFAHQMDAARALGNETGLDFIESQAMKLIAEGNAAVIIHALKALARKRGWIEKTDFGIDPLKIEVTYETSREYLVSKLLSYDAAGDQSGQIIEHEPQGAVPASI